MKIDYKFEFEDENEKPLDRLVYDGGYTSIFRRIGFVGDSLSSGEFEAINSEGNKTYHDMFEYSWGQYIARMCGSKGYNFSRGGMTASEYCTSYAEAMRFWNPENACQCYVIALGINDLHNQNQEIGSLDDIDINDWRNNAKTFTGYYSCIIQRLKEIQPRAKFFLMTMANQPHLDDVRQSYTQKHRELLYKLADFFDNTYVLDIYKYGPVYDGKFNEKFFLGGHLNPLGYRFTGVMVASYIDYIIRHNIDDFREVGFIGTNLHG